MKLVIQMYDRKITIEHEREDLSFGEMLQDVIVPALKAIGYAEETIREWFPEEY